MWHRNKVKEIHILFKVSQTLWIGQETTKTKQKNKMLSTNVLKTQAYFSIRLKNYKLVNLDHIFNWIFKGKTVDKEEFQNRKLFKT